MDKINSVFGTSLGMEVKACLMGLVEEKGILRDTQTTIIRCLFQGKKLIAWKWQTKDPPTAAEWVKEVREVISKEKYIYKKRGNYKKFEKIWKLWMTLEDARIEVG